MILGQLGLDIGPAVAGLGVVGIAVGFGAQRLVRDYLNGALILIENQFARGDVIRAGRRRGHGRGLHPAADDAARPRRRRPHRARTARSRSPRNLTRVWARINQDVTVAYGTDIDTAIEVVDEVGREMAADPVWKRRVLEAPRVERVAGARPNTASRSRSSARSARPTSGPPPASSASACSPPSGANGIEIPRPQRVVSRDVARARPAGAAGPRPTTPRRRLTWPREAE